MRIALATCSRLPSHERDDLPLLAALRERGVSVAQPVWDDAAVEWGSFDAVLIRTTWDYQDKHAAFVAWAERVGGMVPLFNPAPVVGWNTHKSYLRELAGYGVPLARTRWLAVGEAVELAGVVRELGIERGFLKPVVGANSRNTLRFEVGDGEQLAAADEALRRLSRTHEMMLQPYLASVEREGEVSAIYFDDVLSHAVRKRPVAGDYRVQDDFGASDEPIELDTAQRDACARTLAGLRELVRARGWAIELPLLYARIDLLRDDDGQWVLNELELVEPSLFLRHAPHAAGRLADALLARAAGSS